MVPRDKVKRYCWLVAGMEKCVEVWRGQISEPERTGMFDDWLYSDNQAAGMTATLDELASLACEVDPEAVQIWQRVKRNLSDIRIRNYQLAKAIDGQDRPLPTREEETAALIEEAEARATGGASLVQPHTGLPPGVAKGGQ